MKTNRRLEFVPQFKWLAAIVAGVTLAVSACGASGHGYPEKVSRLLPDGSRLYWLDNDRVFVPGYAPDDKLLDENGKPKKGLYILDTRNNTYVRHADLGHYSRFCFNEGFVTYSPKNKGLNDKESVQMEGKFGQEKLLPPGVRFNADFINNGSYTDCPRTDREKRLRPEHAEPMHRGLAVHAVFLREQDGYILADMCTLPYPECTIPVKETFDLPVKLYRPERADAIELPILAKELSLGSYIRYVEWINKYLVVPAVRRDVPYQYLNYGLYGKAPYQVYLMSPNGEIEAITIPEGKWLPPSNAAWTRGGLYFNGNMGTEQGEGGWLLKPDGKLKRIFELTAPTDSISVVSPDGCKLAVPVSFYGNKPRNPFIRIVDFCSKN